MHKFKILVDKSDLNFLSSKIKLFNFEMKKNVAFFTSDTKEPQIFSFLLSEYISLPVIYLGPFERKEMIEEGRALHKATHYESSANRTSALFNCTQIVFGHVNHFLSFVPSKKVVGSCLIFRVNKIIMIFVENLRIDIDESIIEDMSFFRYSFQKSENILRMNRVETQGKSDTSNYYANLLDTTAINDFSMLFSKKLEKFSFPSASHADIDLSLRVYINLKMFPFMYKVDSPIDLDSFKYSFKNLLNLEWNRITGHEFDNVWFSDLELKFELSSLNGSFDFKDPVYKLLKVYFESDKSSFFTYKTLFQDFIRDAHGKFSKEIGYTGKEKFSQTGNRDTLERFYMFNDKHTTNENIVYNQQVKKNHENFMNKHFKSNLNNEKGIREKYIRENVLKENDLDDIMNLRENVSIRNDIRGVRDRDIRNIRENVLNGNDVRGISDIRGASDRINTRKDDIRGVREKDDSTSTVPGIISSCSCKNKLYCRCQKPKKKKKEIEFTQFGFLNDILAQKNEVKKKETFFGNLSCTEKTSHSDTFNNSKMVHETIRNPNFSMGQNQNEHYFSKYSEKDNIYSFDPENEKTALDSMADADTILFRFILVFIKSYVSSMHPVLGFFSKTIAYSKISHNFYNNLSLSDIRSFIRDNFDFQSIYRFETLLSSKGRFLINKLTRDMFDAYFTGDIFPLCDFLEKNLLNRYICIRSCFDRYKMFHVEKKSSRIPGLSNNSCKGLVDQITSKVSNKLSKLSSLDAYRSQSLKIRYVTLTPFDLICSAPLFTLANRVLRNFRSDFFIRVNFKDEGDLVIKKTDSNRLVYERIRYAMKNGISIGSRRFFFLATSSSQLKQHSAWFVCPYLEFLDLNIDPMFFLHGRYDFNRDIVVQGIKMHLEDNRRCLDPNCIKTKLDSIKAGMKIHGRSTMVFDKLYLDLRVLQFIIFYSQYRNTKDILQKNTHNDNSNGLSLSCFEKMLSNISQIETKQVLIGSDFVRSWMGSFSLIKNIGKYAIRLGQALSSTLATVYIENIVDLPDVMRNGYCFSDGVGRIPISTAESVCKFLGLADMPSAFQIRIGGYKGVVGVYKENTLIERERGHHNGSHDDFIPLKNISDSKNIHHNQNFKPKDAISSQSMSSGCLQSLREESTESANVVDSLQRVDGHFLIHSKNTVESKDNAQNDKNSKKEFLDNEISNSATITTLFLRDSMKKFHSSHNQLEIVTYSQNIPCYLNRQIIFILIALGVDQKVFAVMQDEFIDKIFDNKEYLGRKFFKGFEVGQIDENEIDFEDSMKKIKEEQEIDNRNLFESENILKTAENHNTCMLKQLSVDKTSNTLKKENNNINQFDTGENILKTAENHNTCTIKHLSVDNTSNILKKEEILTDKPFNSRMLFHNTLSFDHFLLSVQETGVNRLLRNLISKSRIFVCKGRLLIGILDEYDCLEENEVYVRHTVCGAECTDVKCYLDRQKRLCSPETREVHSQESTIGKQLINTPAPNLKSSNKDAKANNSESSVFFDSSTNVVLGPVAIAKNPCLHPGDIRTATAVFRPQLSHLKDVLVFSAKGARPLFNMCSGSDLDGDQYTIIWDPKLIPPKTFPPDQYASSSALEKDVVTMNDVISFYIKYMRDDQLGLIANSHLAHCDRLGIFSRESLSLAQLFNKGVDFPKTGYVAKIPTDLLAKSMPDFMEQSFSYRSEHIIGVMFRRAKLVSNIQYDECVCCTNVTNNEHRGVFLRCKQVKNISERILEIIREYNYHKEVFIDDKIEFLKNQNTKTTKEKISYINEKLSRRSKKDKVLHTSNKIKDKCAEEPVGVSKGQKHNRSSYLFKNDFFFLDLKDVFHNYGVQLREVLGNNKIIRRLKHKVSKKEYNKLKKCIQILEDRRNKKNSSFIKNNHSYFTQCNKNTFQFVKIYKWRYFDTIKEVLYKEDYFYMKNIHNSSVKQSASSSKKIEEAQTSSFNKDKSKNDFISFTQRGVSTKNTNKNVLLQSSRKFMNEKNTAHSENQNYSDKNKSKDIFDAEFYRSKYKKKQTHLNGKFCDFNKTIMDSDSEDKDQSFGTTTDFVIKNRFVLQKIHQNRRTRRFLYRTQKSLLESDKNILHSNSNYFRSHLRAIDIQNHKKIKEIKIQLQRHKNIEKKRFSNDLSVYPTQNVENLSKNSEICNENHTTKTDQTLFQKVFIKKCKSVLIPKKSKNIPKKVFSENLCMEKASKNLSENLLNKNLCTENNTNDLSVNSNHRQHVSNTEKKNLVENVRKILMGQKNINHKEQNALDQSENTNKHIESIENIAISSNSKNKDIENICKDIDKNNLVFEDVDQNRETRNNLKDLDKNNLIFEDVDQNKIIENSCKVINIKNPVFVDVNQNKETRNNLKDIDRNNLIFEDVDQNKDKENGFKYIERNNLVFKEVEKVNSISFLKDYSGDLEICDSVPLQSISLNNPKDCISIQRSSENRSLQVQNTYQNNKISDRSVLNRFFRYTDEFYTQHYLENLLENVQKHSPEARLLYELYSRELHALLSYNNIEEELHALFSAKDNILNHKVFNIFKKYKTKIVENLKNEFLIYKILSCYKESFYECGRKFKSFGQLNNQILHSNEENSIKFEIFKKLLIYEDQVCDQYYKCNEKLENYRINVQISGKNINKAFLLPSHSCKKLFKDSSEKTSNLIENSGIGNKNNELFKDSLEKNNKLSENSGIGNKYKKLFKDSSENLKISEKIKELIEEEIRAEDFRIGIQNKEMKVYEEEKKKFLRIQKNQKLFKDFAEKYEQEKFKKVCLSQHNEKTAIFSNQNINNSVQAYKVGLLNHTSLYFSEKKDNAEQEPRKTFHSEWNSVEIANCDSKSDNSNFQNNSINISYEVGKGPIQCTNISQVYLQKNSDKSAHSFSSHDTKSQATVDHVKYCYEKISEFFSKEIDCKNDIIRMISKICSHNEVTSQFYNEKIRRTLENYKPSTISDDSLCFTYHLGFSNIVSLFLDTERIQNYILRARKLINGNPSQNQAVFYKNCSLAHESLSKIFEFFSCGKNKSNFIINKLVCSYFLKKVTILKYNSKVCNQNTVPEIKNTFSFPQSNNTNEENLQLLDTKCKEIKVTNTIQSSEDSLYPFDFSITEVLQILNIKYLIFKIFPRIIFIEPSKKQTIEKIFNQNIQSIYEFSNGLYFEFNSYNKYGRLQDYIILSHETCELFYLLRVSKILDFNSMNHVLDLLFLVSIKIAVGIWKLNEFEHIEFKEEICYRKKTLDKLKNIKQKNHEKMDERKDFLKKSCLDSENTMMQNSVVQKINKIIANKKIQKINHFCLKNINKSNKTYLRTIVKDLMQLFSEICYAPLKKADVLKKILSVKTRKIILRKITNCKEKITYLNNKITKYEDFLIEAENFAKKLETGNTNSIKNQENKNIDQENTSKSSLFVIETEENILYQTINKNQDENKDVITKNKHIESIDISTDRSKCMDRGYNENLDLYSENLDVIDKNKHLDSIDISQDRSKYVDKSSNESLDVYNQNLAVYSENLDVIDKNKHLDGIDISQDRSKYFDKSYNGNLNVYNGNLDAISKNKHLDSIDISQDRSKSIDKSYNENLDVYNGNLDAISKNKHLDSVDISQDRSKSIDKSYNGNLNVYNGNLDAISKNKHIDSVDISQDRSKCINKNHDDNLQIDTLTMKKNQLFTENTSLVTLFKDFIPSKIPSDCRSFDPKIFKLFIIAQIKNKKNRVTRLKLKLERFKNDMSNYQFLFLLEKIDFHSLFKWISGSDSEKSGNIMYSISIIYMSNHSFISKFMAAEKITNTYHDLLDVKESHKINQKIKYRRLNYGIIIAGMFDSKDTAYMKRVTSDKHFPNVQKYIPILNNQGRCDISHYKEDMRFFILNNIGFHLNGIKLKYFSIHIYPAKLYFTNLKNEYANNNIEIETITNKIMIIGSKMIFPTNERDFYTLFENDHSLLDQDTFQSNIQSRNIEIISRNHHLILTIDVTTTRFLLFFKSIGNNEYKCYKITRDYRVISQYLIFDKSDSLIEITQDDILFAQNKVFDTSCIELIPLSKIKISYNNTSNNFECFNLPEKSCVVLLDQVLDLELKKNISCDTNDLSPDQIHRDAAVEEKSPFDLLSEENENIIKNNTYTLSTKKSFSYIISENLFKFKSMKKNIYMKYNTTLYDLKHEDFDGLFENIWEGFKNMRASQNFGLKK